MIRRIAITITSSTVIYAFVVCSSTSSTNATRVSQTAASDTSDMIPDATLSRSGYIVASS